MVGTRLISPVWAVAFAAFFNFAAYFLALKWPALHNVAETIGKGLVDKDVVTPAVVFGALIGAMFWNVVTWVKGIPSSSSHALVGGIVGAGVAHAGFPSIQWIGLNKTLIAIVLSPMLGLILTMAIMLATSWLVVRASARGAERTFRGLHLVSSGTLSLSHGLNDAQKTMGLISVLLYSTGYLHGHFTVPNWVALELLYRDGPGDTDRRLASHRDDGDPDHQAVAAPGLQRFGRRVADAVCRIGARDSGIDDPHRDRLRRSARARHGGRRRCGGE